MQSLLAWLAGLPPAVLYLALFVLAGAENVFPPLPTDTIVAFGTWLAARGNGSAFAAFLVTSIGNVVGAAGTYWLGRRHGTLWLQRKFPSLADERGEARLRALYARYGVLALVVSRFIPGVRSVVPPFAGAFGVPASVAIGAIGVASVVWYGLISYLAYKAGTDWDGVVALLARSGRLTAIAALALAGLAAIVWFVTRRRRSRA
ncbi:MAG TPA: DedA family protein [Gemmatimonadaceae bacterium]